MRRKKEESLPSLIAGEDPGTHDLGETHQMPQDLRKCLSLLDLNLFFHEVDVPLPGKSPLARCQYPSMTSVWVQSC